MNLTGSIEIQDDNDRTVVVEWDSESACKGARERNGLQLEPDFPAD